MPLAADVALLLKGRSTTHVVVTPLAKHIHVGDCDHCNNSDHYFVVATVIENKFIFDRIDLDSDTGPPEEERCRFIAALAKQTPIVIHDMACELEAAQLCEALSPCKETTLLLRGVEHEAKSMPPNGGLPPDPSE